MISAGMEVEESVTNSNQNNQPMKQSDDNGSEKGNEDTETLLTLSTRLWAEKNNYDPKILLNKVREIQTGKPL